MPPVPPITWQIVALLLAVIAGVTFLGYEHDVGSDLIGAVYTGILSAVLVGHFATKGAGGGGP